MMMNGSCPAITKPTSGGTMHSFPEQSADDGTVQVWKAKDSPHIVATYDLTDIQLTIEPCAYVLMGGASAIIVGRSGRLTAAGTADQPIAIDSLDPTDQWDTIDTEYVTPNGEPEDTQGGYIQMAYVTMSGGGFTSTGSRDPMLAAHGFDANVENLPPTEHLDLQHVVVQHGSDYGILLDLGATFSAASTDVTVKDQTIAPVHIGFRNIDAVPAGTYSGAIEVDNDVNGLFRSAEVHDRGVPYVLGEDGVSSRFTVGLPTGPAATLTVDPGVTLQFRPSTVLEVDKTGTLIAQGTDAKPIVFTSNASAPQPGAWTGIQFLDVPSAASTLDHVHVEYAGDMYQSGGLSCSVDLSANSDTYAAISFASRPATELVTNSMIDHSAGDGIGRTWDGAPLDFEATNSFSDIAACKQSFPVPTGGDCPDPVPCD
jgi:hypothetical protein